MARTALSRRVRKSVAYPPLCDMSDLQRREFHEALLDADCFKDLPGKLQAAILKAEENALNWRRLAPGSSACPPADRARRSFAWIATARGGERGGAGLLLSGESASRRRRGR